MYALSLCMIQQVRSSKRGSTELYFSKMLAVFYNHYQGTTTILSCDWTWWWELGSASETICFKNLFVAHVHVEDQGYTNE